MAKSLLLAATFLAICSIAAGLPGGAPTFGNVCNDLTQQHFGSSGLIAPISCETLCPYTVSLTNVGGGAVPAGKEGFYRCGSMHRRKLKLVSINLSNSIVGLNYQGQWCLLQSCRSTVYSSLCKRL